MKRKRISIFHKQEELYKEMPSADSEEKLRDMLSTHKEALQKEVHILLFRTLPKAALAGGLIMMTYFTVRWLASRKKHDENASSQGIATSQRNSPSGLKKVLKNVASVVAIQMAPIALGLVRERLLKYLQRPPANKALDQAPP